MASEYRSIARAYDFALNASLPSSFSCSDCRRECTVASSGSADEPSGTSAPSRDEPGVAVSGRKGDEEEDSAAGVFKLKLSIEAEVLWSLVKYHRFRAK